MFYANKEPELFPAPKKDFVSVLGAVSNLKDDNQLAPSLHGELKLHVQFDRETQESKTYHFEDQLNFHLLGFPLKEGEAIKNRVFDKSIVNEGTTLK